MEINRYSTCFRTTQTLLNNEYGEAKGTEHWVKYQTFWAKPVEAHILKQTSL